jgi:hypothetical protein
MQRRSTGSSQNFRNHIDLCAPCCLIRAIPAVAFDLVSNREQKLFSQIAHRPLIIHSCRISCSGELSFAPFPSGPLEIL